MNICHHIKAKGAPEFTTLYDHLYHVRLSIEKFAECLDFDVEIAKMGAVFHDIGKASPIFQERLCPNIGLVNQHSAMKLLHAFLFL